MLPQCFDAGGGGPAGDFVGLLDGHRHAVQRAPVLAPGQGPVRLAGALAGLLEAAHHHRVQGAVEALDTVYEVFQGGLGGDFPVLDTPGQCRGADQM
jgi:hypothetical protein